MFDVTNKLSFESLDYWLQEFTSNGGKHAIIAVVANKVRHLFQFNGKFSSCQLSLQKRQEIKFYGGLA